MSASDKSVITDPLRNGWRLTGFITALLIIIAVIITIISPTPVEAARMVIRMTARTSLALFLLAFTASALTRLSPSRFTYWLRANRRYIGVSFASSHAIHAIAITTLAKLDPILFQSLTNIGSFIGGGITYLFIILMTFTSFDRTTAMVGPKTWRIIHTAGIWFLWISFTLNFGKRIPQNPLYWIPVGLLFAALAVRIIARFRKGKAISVM